MKKFLILCAILGFTTASMGDMFSFFEKSTVEKAKEAYESNDFRSAAQLYSLACSQNDFQACWWAGFVYNSGGSGTNRIEIDSIKAQEYFTKACNGGNLSGCKDAQSIQNAMKRTEEFSNQIASCDRGDMNACAYVGFEFYKGISFSRNKSKGEHYTKKACDGGNLHACSLLTEIYYKENKFFEAFDIAGKACSAGDASGCQSIGFLYENGQGTRFDIDKALEFYAKACDMKDAIGCQKYKQLKSSQNIQQNSQNDNYQQQQLEIQRQQLAQEKERLESEESRDSYNRAINSLQNLGNQMSQGSSNRYPDALDMMNAQKQQRRDNQTNYQLRQINNNLNGIRYGY